MSKILIGKIATVHGVKGLVKILPYCDDMSLLNGDIDTNAGNTLSITLKNPLGKYMLAAVDGINDRTAAEVLRGTELFIDAQSLPETDDDTYYIKDLIDRAVVENDIEIGTITGIDNFGAGDLLDIRLNTGGTFYMPFHGDYVLDVTHDKIIVQNHEDLLFE